MATDLSSQTSTEWTFADVLTHLGGIPLERIRAYPPPGSATEKDVLEIESRTGRICELIDGVLVEKTMGYYESRLAAIIIHLIEAFLEGHDLGIVLAPDGTLQILPGQVRIPDVCFLSWEKFPDRELPRQPIPAVAPDLAIEVLSTSNTEGEMQRKLQDYFTAGVRLVWYIDPESRNAQAHTSPTESVTISEKQSLSGGDVLPGFELPLAELFAKAGRQSPE